MIKTQDNQNLNSDNELKKQEQPALLSINEIVATLQKEQREKLIAGYDLMKFAKIFEDGDIMSTVHDFFKHGLNISETSRKLYMHRNTLIYRLDKIQKVTGLDIRLFEMAVTFEILRSLYFQK